VGEMIRRILFSVITIAIAAAMVGVGLSAIFSDSETSTGNRITTSGSPDLFLQEGNQLGEGVQNTWVMSNMVPGSVCGNTINIYDIGDGGTRVSVSVVNICTDLGTEASDTAPGWAEGMDEYLQIIVLDYTYPKEGTLIKVSLLYQDDDNPTADDDDSSTLWNELDDLNGNGWVDLDDFENQIVDAGTGQKGISNLPPPPPYRADYTSLRMTIRFHQDASNDYQGDKVEMTMTFTLEG
jgi:hypothetical protein